MWYREERKKTEQEIQENVESFTSSVEKTFDSGRNELFI
jgi:hypothetical protein